MGGRGKAAVATIAAFFLAWPGAGTGQMAAPTGSHIVRAGPAEGPSALNATDSGRVALPAFAACLVEHDQPEVERLIAGFADDRLAKSLTKLAVRDCLNWGDLSMTDQLLRGALYAELYRRSYGRRAPSIAGVTIDWWVDAKGKPEDEGNLYVGLRQFAECLVQKHPAESRQLMLVPPLSRREADALGAMTPDMGPCLVAGAELKFSKPVLEGLIAEVLYRLSAKAGAALAGHAPG